MPLQTGKCTRGHWGGGLEETPTGLHCLGRRYSINLINNVERRRRESSRAPFVAEARPLQPRRWYSENLLLCGSLIPRNRLRSRSARSGKSRLITVPSVTPSREPPEARDAGHATPACWVGPAANPLFPAALLPVPWYPFAFFHPLPPGFISTRGLPTIFHEVLPWKSRRSNTIVRIAKAAPGASLSRQHRPNENLPNGKRKSAKGSFTSSWLSASGFSTG